MPDLHTNPLLVGRGRCSGGPLQGRLLVGRDLCGGGPLQDRLRACPRTSLVDDGAQHRRHGVVDTGRFRALRRRRWLSRLYWRRHRGRRSAGATPAGFGSAGAGCGSVGACVGSAGAGCGSTGKSFCSAGVAGLSGVDPKSLRGGDWADPAPAHGDMLQSSAWVVLPQAPGPKMRKPMRSASSASRAICGHCRKRDDDEPTMPGMPMPLSDRHLLVCKSSMNSMRGRGKAIGGSSL